MQESGVMIPGDGVTLEGALATPDGGGPFPAVVVCHPHPQYGGDMHNNVVVAMTQALVERGIVVLRFNFRGVGGSDGSHDNGQGEGDDVRAALAHVGTFPEVDASSVGLAGYSFGASVAAAVGGDAVPALALISTPAQSLRALVGKAPLPSDSAPQLAVLLIVGDRDQYCHVATVQAVAAWLPGCDVETEIVTGADHFLFGHEGEVAGSVGDFFAGRLIPD